MSIADLVKTISGYKYRLGAETDFQNGVARALELHGIAHQREWDLGRPYGRIDFFLPESGVGIELKTKGSPGKVLRQLHRYACCPQIHGLVLVTGCARLAFIPAELNGKPIVTAALWPGQF